MINMIKMDVYRMFRTKSMYVVWIVLAGMLLFSTVLCKGDVSSSQTEQTIQEEEESDLNIGMAVMLPSTVKKTITVADIFFANAQGKFYALFLVIFTVLFSTADRNSGYIKHIGGQVTNRYGLVLSKAVALFFFTILTLIGAVLFQACCNYFIFGYLKWGIDHAMVRYFITQILLHYALAVICMSISIFLKSHVVSMVFAICLTMNVMMIFYSLLDYLLQRIGMADITIYEYTVTGGISLLSMQPDMAESFRACGIAGIFIIMAVGIGCFVFQKRDILK